MLIYCPERRDIFCAPPQELVPGRASPQWITFVSFRTHPDNHSHSISLGKNRPTRSCKTAVDIMAATAQSHAHMPSPWPLLSGIVESNVTVPNANLCSVRFNLPLDDDNLEVSHRINWSIEMKGQKPPDGSTLLANFIVDDRGWLKLHQHDLTINVDDHNDGLLPLGFGKDLERHDFRLVIGEQETGDLPCITLSDWTAYIPTAENPLDAAALIRLALAKYERVKEEDKVWAGPLITHLRRRPPSNRLNILINPRWNIMKVEEWENLVARALASSTANNLPCSYTIVWPVHVSSTPLNLYTANSPFLSFRKASSVQLTKGLVNLGTWDAMHEKGPQFAFDRSCCESKLALVTYCKDLSDDFFPQVATLKHPHTELPPPPPNKSTNQGNMDDSNACTAILGVINKEDRPPPPTGLLQGPNAAPHRTLKEYVISSLNNGTWDLTSNWTRFGSITLCRVIAFDLEDARSTSLQAVVDSNHRFFGCPASDILRADPLTFCVLIHPSRLSFMHWFSNNDLKAIAHAIPLGDNLIHVRLTDIEARAFVLGKLAEVNKSTNSDAFIAAYGPDWHALIPSARPASEGSAPSYRLAPSLAVGKGRNVYYIHGLDISTKPDIVRAVLAHIAKGLTVLEAKWVGNKNARGSALCIVVNGSLATPTSGKFDGCRLTLTIADGSYDVALGNATQAPRKLARSAATPNPPAPLDPTPSALSPSLSSAASEWNALTAEKKGPPNPSASPSSSAHSSSSSRSSSIDMAAEDEDAYKEFEPPPSTEDVIRKLSFPTTSSSSPGSSSSSSSSSTQPHTPVRTRESRTQHYVSPARRKDSNLSSPNYFSSLAAPRSRPRADSSRSRSRSRGRSDSDNGSPGLSVSTPNPSHSHKNRPSSSADASPGKQAKGGPHKSRGGTRRGRSHASTKQ